MTDENQKALSDVQADITGAELDDLRALWQSAPSVMSPDSLVNLVADQQRQRRQSMAIRMGIIVIVAISVGVLELQGAMLYPGLLFGLMVICACAEFYMDQRRQKMLAETAGKDPKTVLGGAIKDARNQLLSARMMYGGFPLGFIAGFILAPVFTNRTAQSTDIDATDAIMIVVLLLGTLLVAIGYGIIWARKARARLKMLLERKADLESGDT